MGVLLWLVIGNVRDEFIKTDDTETRSKKKIQACLTWKRKKYHCHMHNIFSKS